MSKYKVNVAHVPIIKEYRIGLLDLWAEYKKFGVECPFPPSDMFYYFTDAEGWGKILSNLTFKSGLYKEDKFDCEDYAMKAQTLCAERYGLNTLRYTYGDSPMGRHGFNTFWTGDEFLIFEPNTNGINNIEGYVPLKVLL